jgi:hypothetical protein
MCHERHRRRSTLMMVLAPTRMLTLMLMLMMLMTATKTCCVEKTTNMSTQAQACEVCDTHSMACRRLTRHWPTMAIRECKNRQAGNDNE